ncbi:MAG TPA: hypothetical protein VKG62_03325 [Solirubrobacteraceae bacterium]|nr:hypothetical protein [Solirubrobacteraceae bacterium]
MRRARGASPASRILVAAACSLLAVAASGCGGTRQDAHEPTGTYPMEVVRASFPLRQAVAKQTRLALVLRNTGTATVPNVAVTVDSFYYTSDFPELASDKRPVWVIERGPGKVARPPVATQDVSQPGSGQTAYVNTWALGPLPPGQSRAFIWGVVPVKPGVHIVHFQVAAGLSGKAKAVLATGGPVQGAFLVHIAGEPPPTYVNPNTGRVAVGSEPPHTETPHAFVNPNTGRVVVVRPARPAP